MKLLRENPPAVIVVAYGTNDWAHTDSAEDLVENMSRYLAKLADRFCDTPDLRPEPRVARRHRRAETARS